MNTEDPGESKEDQRDEMDTDDDDQITKLENQANEAWEKREEKPLRRILNRMGGLLDVLVVDQSNDEHKRLSSLILKYSQHHRKLLDEKEDSEEEVKEAHSTNDQTLRRLTQANEDPKKKFQILHCEIQCDSLFTNDGKLRADQDNLLSIECLDELRMNDEQDEQFLPSNRMLYVRECMQDMFQRLATRIRSSEKRILIGSPGVGKSILIFLATIRQAQMIQQQDEKVIFVRQTTSELYISVFLMEPHPELPSVVNVFYSREVLKKHDVLGTVDDLQERFNLQDRKKLAIFIDGPKHNDNEAKRNADDFNYFCTSGGYPQPKSNVLDAENLEVWVLSGWKGPEMVQTLTTLGNTTTKEKAQELYELFGGSIRRALRVALQKSIEDKEGKIEKIKMELTETVRRAPRKAKVLALQSNEPIASDNNWDRMRTMFEDKKVGAPAIQLVDSIFILDLLRASLATQPVREAYELAKIVENAAARGWFFEELMHCWFKESKPGCINDFVRSTGSQRDSPRELNKANLYWVPSTSNFPNIDAAFICNKTLVCLQYTVANKHNFNTKTFQQGFIDNLGYLEFECVEIYFVVPTGTDFQTSNEEEFSVQYNNNTMNCTAMCKQIEVDPSRNELIAAAIGRGIPGMYEEHGDASMLDA